jgi:hypothetical protein
LYGLPVDGLKAELQQRLRETLDNTAAATHTTKSAKEGTMNTNDNIETANNAALLTEASTHARKTTNPEETDENADKNAKENGDDNSENSDDTSSSSSSKKKSSSSSDTESSTSDNAVSTTNFPI